ncbi:MAG: acyltransferase family protein [Candidatus Thorarchaeota archaeon]|jgi:fucose 4-O-acetylase-like acetyltransferase
MEGEPQLPRFEWIEVTKGIGITFVILVHSMIPWLNPVTIHLSSFTIPLFFVLAGLTYNNYRYRGNLRYFLIARGKQFLIPYVFIYMIMMVLFLPLSSNIDSAFSPTEVFLWFLYGNGPPLSASHLWFLPVLYFGLVLFVITDRAMQRFPYYSRWILVVVFPIIGFLIQSLFIPNLVPWRLSSVFVAATFVFLGNAMRQYRGLDGWLSSSIIRDIAVFLFLSVLLVLISDYNGFTDIAVDNLGKSLFIYMIPGIFGTLLVFLASSALVSFSQSRRLFMALGENSQELYEIHPVFFYLVPIVALPLGLPLIGLEHSTLFWPLRFILGITIGFILTKYVITRNRFLSVLFRGSPRINKSKPAMETSSSDT